MHHAINPWSASQLSTYAAQFGTPDNGCPIAAADRS